MSHLRAVAAAIPLTVYRAAAGGLPILIGLFIAHQWKLGDLAAFTVANAMLAVGLAVADWGATRGLPRNLARSSHESAMAMIASANAFRLLLVAAMLLLVLLAAGTGQLQRDVAVFLFILAPLWIANIFTTNAVSERVVTGETLGIGIGVIAGLSVFAILGATVIALHLGPRWFVASYVAGKIVECSFLLAGRWWVARFEWNGIFATAAALWPFSVQMILAIIYSRLSVFTVERMTSRIELGVFSVAIALYSAMLLIPSSMALTLFPELTRRAHQDDHAGVRRIVVRYAILSAIAVMMGVILLALLSRPIGDVLKMPPPYMPFVIAFAGVALLSVFSTITGFLMQARGAEKLAARLSVVTVLLALLYQLAALSRFGLWGIIGAVAAAEISTVIIFGIALQRLHAAIEENGWS